MRDGNLTSLNSLSSSLSFSGFRSDYEGWKHSFKAVCFFKFADVCFRSDYKGWKQSNITLSVVSLGSFVLEKTVRMRNLKWLGDFVLEGTKRKVACEN